MKKILALLLAAALLGGAALAETDEQTRTRDITIEGVTETVNETLYLFLRLQHLAAGRLGVAGGDRRNGGGRNGGGRRWRTRRRRTPRTKRLPLKRRNPRERGKQHLAGRRKPQLCP